MDYFSAVSVLLVISLAVSSVLSHPHDEKKKGMKMKKAKKALKAIKAKHLMMHGMPMDPVLMAAKMKLMTMKMKPHDFAEYFIVDDEDDMCEDVPDDDIEIGNPMMEMCEDVSTMLIE